MKKSLIIVTALLTLSCNPELEVENCQFLVEVDYVDGVTDQMYFILPTDSQLFIQSHLGSYSLKAYIPSCTFCDYKTLVVGAIRYRLIEKDCTIDKPTKQKM